MSSDALLASEANPAELALHWIAAAVVWLNEMALCFSLWVVSEASASSAGRHSVTAIFTAITYAVSEPVWSLLLVCLPLPSWLPFPSADALQIFSACYGVTGVFLARLLPSWMGNDIDSRKTSPRARCSAVHAAFLLAVQMAALQNSTLLIWAQQLQLPDSRQFPTNFRTDISAVLCFVVFSGCGNFFWCNATGRAWYFQRRSSLRTQIYHLVILLALRWCVRSVLGLSVFPGVELLCNT